MQTSFMHPPFGFALFYLRSVAPKEVKTSDIYWGAVPFVLIQIIMVALIIAFPNIVSIEKKTDMKEQIELKIDIPTQESPDSGTGTDSGTDSGAPNLNFSTEENKESSSSEEPQLNFSTDTEKK
jgi:flagellar biosynthesis/type III secretory pathway M-ring protein FliF/YscJ